MPARRFALLLLVPLLLPACGREPAATPGGPGNRAAGDDAAAVVLATATVRAHAPPITGIATLRAREAVTLTAPASGRVREIRFREGRPVMAGAVLVRLEDDEERAEFAAADTQATIQATRVARIESLQARGLVSQDERDSATQSLQEANARRELARVRLELRTIRAPFAGVLGFRQVSAGTLVRPGDAIVTLDALDWLRADFAVAETLLGQLTPGSPVRARSAAWPGREFAGTLSLVGTRVDDSTRSVTVQARFDNTDGALRPGMLLTVDVPAVERSTLFVPEAALLPENARQYVWRVGADGTAARVEVSTGLRSRGEVEIVAGLAPGDRVVVEGQGNLREGRPVREAATPAPVPAPARSTTP